MVHVKKHKRKKKNGGQCCVKAYSRGAHRGGEINAGKEYMDRRKDFKETGSKGRGVNRYP